MSKYFGTDGFRGEAGIILTADHAYKVGRFLGWYYNVLRERNGDNEPARIVIGKDTRRSSYMFEYSLVAGLTASGADAYLLHVTTTSSVAYIARVDDFDCGIMISASHYSCGFPDPQVLPIIVVDRYLDYFTTIMEDRLWQVLAKPGFRWRNRSGLSMNAAKAA